MCPWPGWKYDVRTGAFEIILTLEVKAYRVELKGADFFFQAEDGIRDYKVTGVQTCALPISVSHRPGARPAPRAVARSRPAARGGRSRTGGGAAQHCVRDRDAHGGRRARVGRPAQLALAHRAGATARRPRPRRSEERRVGKEC